MMPGHLPANPLTRLAALGQSVWLDYIERSMLADGTLARMIADDAVTGMTSNPAIFEKAIGDNPAYRADRERLTDRGLAAAAIYESLTFADVCCAADLLRATYDRSGGRDGYVSIEISPHLAHDIEATVLEAVRVWDTINRANLMIKVPATAAGVAALRRLLALGINVNATLLFSVARYRDIAAAYLAGIEDCVRAGRPVERIASVASFFLSRIDTLVDPRLDTLATAEAHALRGRAAIACARLARQEFRAMLATPRWRRLAGSGARPQRLLWASTSTKDASYSDTKYVEALIGPDTVNTLTPETLAAYRDHGRPAIRIDEALDEAEEIPERLAAIGVDLETVARQLEQDGIDKFIAPYDRAIRELERRAARR
jgi:transaldolase